MMRSYDELLAPDPAWPAIAEAAAASGRVTVLTRDPAAARACLEALQVTTRSTLGAIAHECGGMLIDHGWLRMLGSGHPRLTRVVGAYNAEVEIPLAACVIIGDDVIGGVFAINGPRGALGPARGNVHYFAPDRLIWEDTGMGHSAFVSWAFTGDLAAYYENLRWPGWEQAIATVSGDQALTLYPPPWTVEGKDISKVSRRPAPAMEVLRMQLDVARQLAGG